MIEEEQRIKPRVKSNPTGSTVLEIVGVTDSIDVAIACDDDLFGRIE